MDFLKIDDKRRARRMTIAQLCEQIGVDESTYHKWKSEPSRMKVDTLAKIIDVLEMTDQEKTELF